MMIALGALLYYFSSLTNGMELLIRLSLKTILLVSFPFLLYFVNFYEKVELEYFSKGLGLIKSPSKFIEFVKSIKI